jgi:hypothetical protein
MLPASGFSSVITPTGKAINNTSHQTITKTTIKEAIVIVIFYLIIRSFVKLISLGYYGQAIV